MPKILEKPIGKTCGELTLALKKECGYKLVAPVGKLDPMARGKLLLLIDDETKDMDKYLDKEKTYQFEVVIGLQTDTDDILGLLEKSKDLVETDDLIKEFDCFPDSYEQNFHAFSSIYLKKRYEGKRRPFWWVSTRKLEVKEDIPKKKVSILNKKVLGVKKIDNLKDIILNNLKDVNDGFRTKEIRNQWSDYKFTEYYSVRFEIKVTTGFYVRQFVRDLANKLNTNLMVIDILRTEIHY